MAASGLMLLPGLFKGLHDLSRRVGAVVAASAADAAMFVVAASWEMEVRNSAMTMACMVGVALAAAAAGAVSGSLAADEFGNE